jgi:serralysin
MAVVTFSSDMRPGLRLRDFFTAVEGAISYEADGGQQTATFEIEVDKTILDVVYSGPAISENGEQVSYMEFQRDGVPWLTYGSLGGPILFAYADALSAFQAQGAVAAATIMQGDDQLIGASQSDHLEGYAGNDFLNGGAGADTLDGGSGNDTYIVDNRDDRVFEAAGGGYDVVYTSVGFAMAADAEIEEIRAAEASSLSLFGSDTSNLIVGTSGNDEIDGKGGVDTMIGGAGDDLYIVDNPFDVLWEDIGEGHDTVIASGSYTLGANIETLKAAGGYSSIDLTGNALSNEIVGNAGANVIYGLDGDDRLYGDSGNDGIYGGSGQDVLYGGLGNNSLSPVTVVMTSSMGATEKILLMAALVMTGYMVATGATGCSDRAATIRSMEECTWTPCRVAMAMTGFTATSATILSMVERARTAYPAVGDVTSSSSGIR